MGGRGRLARRFAVHELLEAAVAARRESNRAGLCAGRRWARRAIGGAERGWPAGRGVSRAGPRQCVPATAAGSGRRQCVRSTVIGSHQPFDAATLASLCPTHQDYVAKVKAVTERNLRAGYILKRDADATIAEAERVEIGKR